MPTTTDLATRILKRIGALDPSENVTAEEAADVIAVMDSVYQTEKEMGRFNWPLTDIPTRYQEWFIVYVGWFVQPHFGLQSVTPDDYSVARKNLFSLNQRRDDPRSSRVLDY